MPQIFVYPFLNLNGIYRPLVPVKITNPIDNVSIQMFALLDTGADNCVFPMIVANSTGHNLKGDGVKTSISQGVGKSTVPTWKHTFVITLLAPDKKTPAWESKKMLVDCLDHDSVNTLIGAYNFMEYMDIRFNYKKREVTIEVP